MDPAVDESREELPEEQVHELRVQLESELKHLKKLLAANAIALVYSRLAQRWREFAVVHMDIVYNVKNRLGIHD